MSYAKTIIIGNATRNAEVKYLPKGTAVAEVGIAVNRKYSTESGEKRETVTFYDVVFWGRQAEIAGEYITKGKMVMVDGRMEKQEWDDKETGQKRSKWNLVCETMQLLGGGKQEGGEEEPRQQSKPAGKPVSKPVSRPARPPADPDLDAEDDFGDVPF